MRRFYFLRAKKKALRYVLNSCRALMLAERVGFEPTVVLPLRLISSQVHSTTLPPLLCVEACEYSKFLRQPLLQLGQCRVQNGTLSRAVAAVYRYEPVRPENRGAVLLASTPTNHCTALWRRDAMPKLRSDG